MITTHNKYWNKITVLDNIRFSSQKESRRYGELTLMLRARLITGLVLQPEFELQPKFEKNGVKYRAIKYIADFKYKEKDKIIIEDCKGIKTEVFKIKQKLFEYKYSSLSLRIV